MHAGPPSAASRVGAGLLLLLVSAGALHIADTVAGPSRSGRVDIRPGQAVVHHGDATSEDARALGAFLAATPFPGDDAPFFSGDAVIDVALTRKDEHVTVAFVLKERAWETPRIADAYGAFGSVLRAALYADARGLRVELCDASWTVQRAFNIP